MIETSLVWGSDHLHDNDRPMMDPAALIEAGRIGAHELLDNHRLAHPGSAEDQQIGHAGALGKQKQFLELVERLACTRIVDPAVDPDMFDTLVVWQIGVALNGGI